MSDLSSQPLWAVVALAIGLVTLLLQAYFTLRRPAVTIRMVRLFYWITVSCWVTVGISTSMTDASLGLGWLSDRLLPAAGLLAATLLRWRFEERPQLLLEEHPVEESAEEPGNGEGSNGQSSHEDLDAEDRQLLARLLGLLGRRALHLMIPIEVLPHAYEDDSLQKVLDLLRQRCRNGQRLPILTRDGRRVVGIIDGRNLIPRLHTARAGAEGANGAREERTADMTAAAYCLPIPSIASWDPAERAIEALRQGGRGIVAVQDSRGRVVGLVGWQGIFRLLMGRPVREGHL